MNSLRSTRLAASALALCCAPALLHAQEERDSTAVLPERPTVATHAYVIKPGFVEVEAGAEPTDGGYGADSAAPLADGSAPQGFDIKGNADSMKFHRPDGRWYDATVAEVWFRTAEAAEAAGFVEAGHSASEDEK